MIPSGLILDLFQDFLLVCSSLTSCELVRQHGLRIRVEHGRSAENPAIDRSIFNIGCNTSVEKVAYFVYHPRDLFWYYFFEEKDYVLPIGETRKFVLRVVNPAE